MVFLRWLGIVFLGMLLGSHVGIAASVSEVYAHDFWAPNYHGKRLDFCLSTKVQCGQAVANSYCQMLGYDAAERFTIDYNLGMTSYLDSKKCCKGWECKGFKLIRCTAKTLHQPKRSYYYRSKRFVKPRFNHYRVDWCYQNGQGCGERAAYSFCRRMGYSKMTTFIKEERLAATRALGNQRLCIGKEKCTGFVSITCYR